MRQRAADIMCNGVGSWMFVGLFAAKADIEQLMEINRHQLVIMEELRTLLKRDRADRLGGDLAAPAATPWARQSLTSWTH